MEYLDLDPSSSNPRARLILNSSIDDLHFRAMGPLTKDAEELFDTAVVDVGVERLNLVNDLMSEGLTFTIPDALGTPVVRWEQAAKIGHAQRSMIPNPRGERQMPDRKLLSIPLFATWDDFSFGVRELRASARAGQPIDTSMISQATRRVNEGIEDAAINGIPFNVSGNNAPGLLNAPSVNTFLIGTTWNTATGEEILTDVLNMVDILQADFKFGPYNLYVPTNHNNKLNEDFKANSDKTIRQRLEELMFEGRNLRIRVVDQLPDNRPTLMQMTNDVADVLMGQEPTIISWTDEPGFQFDFLVLAFIVVRFKDDFDGNSGIIVGNI